MSDVSNTLRMPFAEWLFRMSEAELPVQARELAIYAVAFRISSNDELCKLSGHHDRTYDKWKKRLKDDGWVIISRDKGGRGIGIEVGPAFRETPVTFTDLSPKSADKYYARIAHGNTGVSIAEDEAETGVKITETVNETPVTFAKTPVISDASRSPAPARLEPPSGANIPLKTNTPPLPPSQPAASEAGGEKDLVEVNCVTIKGPDFVIDLRAVDQISVLSSLPTESGRAIAEAFAREWAANGNKPNHVMAYLKKMIAGHRNDAAIAEVRLQKAASGTGSAGSAAPTTLHQKQEEGAAQMIEAFRTRRAAKQTGKTP